MKSEYYELFMYIADAFPDLSFCAVQNQKTVIFEHILDHDLSITDFIDYKENNSGLHCDYIVCSIPIRYGIRLIAATKDRIYSKNLPNMFRVLFDHYQAKDSDVINDNSFFFQYLMYSDPLDEVSCLSLLPDNQEYDFSEPRQIILLEISQINKKNPQDDLNTSILTFIRRHPMIHGKDIIGILNPGQFVICKALSGCQSPVRSRYSKICGSLSDDISKAFNVTIRTVVSFTAENMSEYPFCIRTADLLLSLRNPAGSEENSVVFAVDAYPELLVHNLPYDTIQHFFKDYDDLLKNHADWYETLEALVRTNMSITGAAEELYMHKNSLLFRIRNMLEAMRLSSIKNDSVKFFLLLLYHYHQIQP